MLVKEETNQQDWCKAYLRVKEMTKNIVYVATYKWNKIRDGVVKGGLVEQYLLVYQQIILANLQE